MNRNLLLGILSLASSTLHAAPDVEMVFQPVALSAQPAPGLTNTITFSNFEYVSLADDGRIAFTARVSGPDVTSTNNQGLWAGLADRLGLLLRTGDLVPGLTNGERFTYVVAPNIDNYQYVGALADFAPPTSGEASAKAISYGFAVMVGFSGLGLPDASQDAPVLLVLAVGARIIETLIMRSQVINAVGLRVELSGPDIGDTNNQAILAGPPTNATVVARTGFPAPGGSGNFTYFPTDSQALALTRDGNVAFRATATAGDPLVNRDGIWFGSAATLQAVAVANHPAPASLLGPGYTFGFVALPENVDVNARGELAFATYLNGPGLNNANSAFVVAGPPGGLQVIVQSGQPAPGIPGAVFGDFSHVLLGADGAVAFTARYTTNGTDFVSGLWLAPTNGATPRLLMHDGQRAPGTPAGVYFTSDFSVEGYFMNSRNQIVFRSRLGGPGLDPLDTGIWLAEPDGTVNLIVRTGDVLDIGVGVKARVSNVTFGADPEYMAGPEDGRRTPFNDRGEVALLLHLEAATPPFTGPGEGLFIVQTGIILRAERTGNDIRVTFPTLAGKHYRVECKTNLGAGAWSVLAASVAGTGGEVVVTDTNAATGAPGFYRAVRTD